MNITKSPLQLKEFLAFEVNSTVVLNKKEFAEEVVNIDFNRLSNNENSDDREIFAIDIMLDIKPQKGKNGFKAKIHTRSIFELKITKLPKKQRENLQIISAVNIAVSNTRSLINNLVSYYPIKYTLPTFQTIDLIQKKQESLRDRALE